MSPKLQHHFYSNKDMCPATEMPEADMLQLELHGPRLSLPGFKFRDVSSLVKGWDNPEKCELDFLEPSKICLERGY